MLTTAIYKKKFNHHFIKISFIFVFTLELLLLSEVLTKEYVSILCKSPLGDFFRTRYKDEQVRMRRQSASNRGFYNSNW
jgi:hypothetical protein